MFAVISIFTGYDISLVGFVLGLILLIILFYTLLGVYDRISFADSGITIYRLFIKRHYSWDKVSRITFRQAYFGGNLDSHLITIYVRGVGKKLPFDVVIQDYGEILDDIKQYYSTKDKENEQLFNFNNSRLINENLKCISSAFPKYCVNDVQKVADLLIYDYNSINSNKQVIMIKSDNIYIPHRIYYKEVDEDNTKHLTNDQLKILYCYFTRHSDGYLRQKYLRKLFELGEINEWEIPFILLLCGEYVVEILEDVYSNWGLIDDKLLQDFVDKNPKITTTIEGRIASYYGEYYLQYANKKNYVGFKIKKELQKCRASHINTRS